MMGICFSLSMHCLYYCTISLIPYLTFVVPPFPCVWKSGSGIKKGLRSICRIFLSFVWPGNVWMGSLGTWQMPNSSVCAGVMDLQAMTFTLSCGRWRVIYLHWESAKLKSCARPQVLGSSLYYYLDCSSYSFSAPQAITHVSLQKGHCLQWTRVYPSSPTPHNGEADRHNERASAHYISNNPACFNPIMEGCNANFWGLEPFYTRWNLKVISQC